MNINVFEMSWVKDKKVLAEFKLTQVLYLEEGIFIHIVFVHMARMKYSCSEEIQ